MQPSTGPVSQDDLCGCITSWSPPRSHSSWSSHSTGKWDDWDPVAPLNWEGGNWVDCYPAKSLSSEWTFLKKVEIAGFWANELRILYFNTYIFLCKVLILYILMTILGLLIMMKFTFIKTKFFTIIVGVSVSVFVYYINYFSSLFGSNETIPIIMSIWLPHLILFLICLLGGVKINEN